MRHPLNAPVRASGWRLFLPLLVITLVIMAVLNTIDGPLKTSSAPGGILSYEFAGSIEKAAAILASWNADAQARAGFSLGFDFLFLVSYASAISVALLGLGQAVGQASKLATLLGLLAWGQWLAAGLDAVENVALTLMLFGGAAGSWPQVAFWCAAVKFALVGAGLAAVLVVGFYLLTRRVR